MAVPARQRESLAVPSAGPCGYDYRHSVPLLAIYPLPEWERIEADSSSLPALKPAVKRFQRLVLGYATISSLTAVVAFYCPSRFETTLAWRKSSCWWGRATSLSCGPRDLWLAEREAALAAEVEGDVPAELMSLTL